MLGRKQIKNYKFDSDAFSWVYKFFAYMCACRRVLVTLVEKFPRGWHLRGAKALLAPAGQNSRPVIFAPAAAYYKLSRAQKHLVGNLANAGTMREHNYSERLRPAQIYCLESAVAARRQLSVLRSHQRIARYSAHAF